MTKPRPRPIPRTDLADVVTGYLKALAIVDFVRRHPEIIPLMEAMGEEARAKMPPPWAVLTQIHLSD